MISSLVVSSLIAAQPLIWRADGRAEAERDIAAGEMKWKIYGHLAGLTERDKAFARLMQERLGVTVKVIGFCTVEQREVERAEGYNSRIEEELKARFGPDALEQVRTDSETLREQPTVRFGLRVVLAIAGGLLLWRLVMRLGQRVS